MTKIKWDAPGERLYETGVDHAVLYRRTDGEYSTGVAWNGITAITESPSGAEPTALYADNVKYVTLMSAEEFGGTLEAFMWPDEFEECDGTASPVEGVTLGQQPRQPFGLSYRTILGNDVDSNEHGYKLHLVYEALAAPSEKAYATVNDSPEAITFSWEFTTTPVAIEGFKPTAIITINSSTMAKAKLEALEKILYGDEDTDARLPLPDELLTLVGTP